MNFEQRHVPFLLVAAMAGLLLAVFYVRSLSVPKDGAHHPSVGQPLAVVEFEPLANTASPLRKDDLAGKVALINYWGPWCGPCRIEMPELVNLHAQFAADSDFRFVSVSCGLHQAYVSFAELRSATQQFIDEQKISFPVYADTKIGNRAALMDAARTTDFAYPTSVLLGRDGRIRGLWIGYTARLAREVEDGVHAALRER